MWYFDKLFFAVALSILAASDPTSPHDSSVEMNRIVGGTDVKLGEINYQAMVIIPNGWGGGVIIAHQWVLTAASLVYKHVSQPAKVQVRAGFVDPSNPGTHTRKKTASKVFVHDEFDASQQLKTHNIALIKLQGLFRFNDYIGGIPLASSDFKPLDADHGTLSGYGSEDGINATHLQKVAVHIISTQECKQLLRMDVDDTFICTLRLAKDACLGDEGGPFTCNTTLGLVVCGVAFYGIGCGKTPNEPGFHTNIVSFLDFIRETIKSETPLNK